LKKTKAAAAPRTKLRGEARRPVPASGFTLFTGVPVDDGAELVADVRLDEVLLTELVAEADVLALADEEDTADEDEDEGTDELDETTVELADEALELRGAPVPEYSNRTL